jgi:diguanylate cyclase (GGDEF)-like protein/PAS domain S-box-containing protein
MTDLPRSDFSVSRPRLLFGGRWLPALLLAAAYFGAAYLGVELGRPPARVAGAWIANAIALAVLLRQDQRQWPLSFAALAVACFAACKLAGLESAAAFGLTVANLMEVALGAFLLRLWFGRPIRFERNVGDYVRILLVAAGLAPAIGGIVVAAVTHAAYGAPVLGALWAWWAASGMGAILILPVVLSASPANIRRSFTPPQVGEVIGLGLVSASVMAVSVALVRYPFVLFSLPLAAAALRTNPFATALISLVSVATVVVCHLLGLLPDLRATTAAVDAPVTFFASFAVLMPFCISLLIEQQNEERAKISESEERFRNAMEHSAIGIALVGTDGRFLKVNPALCRLLGYADSELQSRSFQQITHPDDLSADLDLVHQVLSGKIDNYTMEKRYFRSDGGLVWALLAVSCVRDKSTGAVLYFVSQIEDITEQKAAKTKLQESESRWNFALESAGQGVWDVDVRANRVFYSPVWKAMFGYAPDEFGDRTSDWEERIHPEDAERVRGMTADCLAGRIPLFECEYRMRHRDGYWKWVLDRGRVIERDRDGAPLRMIGVLTDVTKRKEAEAALKASESRWSFALESARQGVWDYDVVAQRTFYSPVWREILGYAEGEITSYSPAWLDLVHPDDVAGLEAAVEAHVAGRTEFFEREIRMRHKDGRWVWILDHGRLIERDANGAPTRFIGTHTDISKRKEAEAEIALLSQRVQLAVKAGGVGLWEFNPATREMWWDERMREIYGATNSPLTGTIADWLDRIHPDDRKRVEEEGRTAFFGSGTYDAEFRATLPSGEIRHIHAQADVIRNPDGSPRLMVGTNWDITERQRLTEALSQEKERLHITLQSIGDAVISTDTQSRITFMNTVAEELTGWQASEAVGQPLAAVFKIVDEETGETAENPVAACLARDGTKISRDGLIMLSRKGRRDIRNTAAPVQTASGATVGVVLVFQDMTEARRLQRQLTHSATHDALTGLANRASFEAELRRACAELDGGHRQHAVCFIDLDRFKIVNDTAGHAAGDTLLREIGRVIRHNVRGRDVTARLGGDEFGLLLYDCGIEQAEVIAEKMIESIKSIPFAWDGRAYDIGASVGVAAVSEASSVPSELLSQADIACYTAKSLGRNRVAVYRAGESDARRHHRDLQVAAQIRGAIETDRFRLYAQEIRPLQPKGETGRHYEILLRMLDEDGSILEPDAFIPAAERYDLMANIDRWVIRAVLGQRGARIGAEPDLSISINLSANSLNDPQFWPFLASELLTSSLPASRLRLEITETSLINNLTASSRLVESAREAGCAIVLDDFGTGLSSFAYLKRFPIDYLKIDGSFMRSLTESGVDHAIVESINDIAHKLGAETIAEWVETPETVAALTALGVDHAQGYAISAPVPLDGILRPEIAKPGRLLKAG